MISCIQSMLAGQMWSKLELPHFLEILRHDEAASHPNAILGTHTMIPRAP